MRRTSVLPQLKTLTEAEFTSAELFNRQKAEAYLGSETQKKNRLAKASRFFGGDRRTALRTPLRFALKTKSTSSIGGCDKVALFKSLYRKSGTQTDVSSYPAPPLDVIPRALLLSAAGRGRFP